MTSGCIKFTADVDAAAFDSVGDEWTHTVVNDGECFTKGQSGFTVYVLDSGVVQIHWSGVDFADFPEISYFIENRLELISGVELEDPYEVSFSNKSRIIVRFEGNPETDDSGVAVFDFPGFSVSGIEKGRNRFLLGRVSAPIDSVDEISSTYVSVSEELGSEFEVVSFL
jgi:hypothetical protein